MDVAKSIGLFSLNQMVTFDPVSVLILVSKNSSNSKSEAG